MIPFESFAVQISVVDATDLIGLSSASVHVYNDDFDFEWVSAQDGFVTSTLVSGTYNVAIGIWGYQTICSEFTIESSQVEIAFELDKGYSDDFSIDLGWIVENESSLTAGAWERGIPNGTDYQGELMNPNSDAPGDCGSEAYITGNAANASFYEADLDGGRTSIYSPIMDLSSFQTVSLSFSTWFQNSGGQSFPNDSLLIKLTNGSQTTLLYSRTSQNSSAQWQTQQILVPAELILNNTMQLIVETMDYDDSGHLVEAGFDKFLITETELTVAYTESTVINIYPNPSFDGLVNIYLEENETLVSITDISGKLISRTLLNKGANPLNFSTLSKGAYLIVLESSSKKESFLWIFE